MLFDTHCHVSFKDYNDDYRQVIDRAFKQDIYLIDVGIDLESSKKSIALAEEIGSGIWSTLGLHPNYVLDSRYNPAKYIDLAKNPKVVALGEIGLDYYRLADTAKRHRVDEGELKETQKEVLEKFINLSKQTRLPLVVHCRDAHDDMIDILSNYDRASSGFDTRGVMHCFSGDWEQAKRYINLDFYISFTGVVTFKNYQHIDLIKKIPLDKILVETDSPYLTPDPNRGKRNEPSYVKYVAEKIAEIKGISFDEVAEATTANTHKLFHFEKRASIGYTDI